MKFIRLTALAAGAVMALGVSAQAAGTIVVGGKNFTEQKLMAEMTVQLLKAKGFTVEKKAGMGSTVLRKAQENGQIDVYWEYTGTSLVTYNKVKDKLDAAGTYNKVKELDAKKGLVWLKPSNANNTYALAIKDGDASTKGISTLSEMAAAYKGGKALKMAVNAEFPKRPDGLPGLEKAYGFKVSRPNQAHMDSGLTYQALKEGEADIALVFATDGRIAAFGFKVLKDDKGYFPNYALAPVVRKETLDKHPGLKAPLEALAAKLDDATMQRLNGEVAVEKKTIEAVAAKFLKDAGLI